ncbi:asparagine synthase (glutamine-hydrolyzing) [Salidesulfovibrio onnuriiensis]|uniref:asparagine synthase (glutamine-hydrolyzing) n=1 Tax=Salidesulfovibrio onnuriiensis TaxID=2583823 RepID=UPI0011CC9C36|nr:asparagine synthase (glutamine-hydrolyzing) [Salidesulfovibrio onnuriiensis]
MCGIAGIMHLDGEPVALVNLRRMTDAIFHRGPDAEGHVVHGGVGLGHRRLAIIDLSPAGSQPMQSTCGRYIISYNGEVYNFPELKLELEALGWKFRSTSDTEVVLNAFAQWGESCVNRFNGMFAFAVWDKQYRRLFLARDRYGIKPLYYATFGKYFLFGSEQKAILAHPHAKSGIDLEALVEYFTFQNIFTDRTLEKQIRLVPAAHYGWLSLEQPELRLTRYWDYDFDEPAEPRSEEEYVEELDHLFRQAVNRQLVSDVEVCAYLSGGIDSGAITALAAQQMPYIKTFTCGFDLSSASGLELAFDERDKAEALSALFKTEHYEMVLKSGDMERCLPRLAYHLEEPRVGQSYPNFYVAQLASKFGKVVLAGTGGDELFGGYPWRYYQAAVNDDFEHYVDKYYGYWQRLLSREEIAKAFAPVWDEVKLVNTRDIFRDVFTRRDISLTSPSDYVNHSLYFEARTFLHGLLLVEDRLSMAHSLETRVPFLDNDLVDFAMKIPAKLKLGNLGEMARIDENEPGKRQKYFNQPSDGKSILRKALSRHVPREVVERKKQGFSAPDASWFKGESIEYVKGLLLDEKAEIYKVLDYDVVKVLLGEHFEGHKNRRLLIWSLLSLSHFIGVLRGGACGSW